MLYKNTLIKIKKSLGRYLSLFIIVMVGVGFYAGIQATAPDILAVADDYYTTHGLMDFKIVSTMGLTDSDVQALKKMDHVKEVVPSYSLDALDQDKTVRVHAIEKSVNRVRLLSGRMPQNDTECLADGKTYQIGDSISLTCDANEHLKTVDFTVTGTVESVLYLTEDYGNTSVGSGKLSSFIFIRKGNFTSGVYTEIYLIADGTVGTGSLAAYSENYDRTASLLNDELVKIKPERENARYREIYDEANQEIIENEVKLKEERAKGEKALNSAKAQLDENAKKLRDGREELKKSEADLQANIKKQNAEFEAAKNKIAEALEEVDSALAQNGLEKQNLNTKIDQLTAAIETLKTQLDRLPDGSPARGQLSAEIGQYSIQYEALLRLRQSIDALTAQESELNKGIKTFQSEITKAKNEIETGKNEIAENEKMLADGYKEYNENLEKFHTEISDAEAKIQEGKTKLSNIEQPKWHIFDRDGVVGYRYLKSSIDVVASVASVFPLFFILIAILMTSNSMTRMIAEERGELGTLTSLGYKDRSIVSTYLFYVLSASGLGAVTGFFAGCRVIPPLIYLNFRTILPALALQYNMLTLLVILTVALTLMTLVTVLACNKALKQNPAALMRPVPPKKGQSIFLEKIGPVWKRLSFIWKITIRNLFRYKKRAFVTIAGVAGCTSLLLTGFGLKNSMDGIAQKQYGEIFRYSNMITLKNETQSIGGELASLLEKARIEKPLLIKQTAFTCESSGKSLDAFLIVPENETVFYDYYHLTNRPDTAKLMLNNSGVVITQKLSDVFKANKGDTITVKDADNNAYDLSVAGVAENYTENYLYMNPALYSKVFGQSASYNTVVSRHDTDEKALGTELMDSGLVLNVAFTGDAIQKVLDSSESLNGIIMLIVAVASLLAAVVLYNLTSISISERTREIATLKVLGFHDGETNAYIYREAFILTLISIGAGLVLGIFLHRFVIDLIEGTTLVFFKKIKWSSFILSGLLTLTLSFMMQLIIYFKLRTIDMIQSLKSVE